MTISPRHEKLGRALKRARKKKGLSLRQVCDVIPYRSALSLSYIEKGRARIPLDKLAALCRFYGIKIGELLDNIYN